VSSVSVADAYSQTGAAWDTGPHRIYSRLSEALIERVPGGVSRRRVLDLGAGTGIASRSAIEAGAARVVAVDVAHGALRVSAATRPVAVAADVRRLPFADASFDAAVAAFSLNHVTDPATAATEARRVLREGGGMALSAYADDDTHPVKRVVDTVCAARGWAPPQWYRDMQRNAVPLLATPERALSRLSAALPDAEAEVLRVGFPELDRPALVAWRLGMAHIAPFVASLSPPERKAIACEAVESLDDTPLVRSIVVVSWHKEAGE
jgi:ubiquinone/menaquinone biosynthesis C-methylase UbiE